MRNTASVAAALFCGFILQALWWRVRGSSLSSILIIFALVFAALTFAGLHWNLVNMESADFARLFLFYVSVVLCYTIICSAVEVRSPSLSMITYIANYGTKCGCPEKDLERHFLVLDAMPDRLRLMQAGGLVRIEDDVCTLTTKGRAFAELFDIAARFFGLPKGG